jgi:hypothetical protein
MNDHSHCRFGDLIEIFVRDDEVKTSSGNPAGYETRMFTVSLRVNSEAAAALEISLAFLHETLPAK